MTPFRFRCTPQISSILLLPTFNQIFPVLGYIAIKEPTSPTSVSSPYIVHNSTGSSLSHINVGYGGSPAFADIDGDGDLDLVMGSADGTILSWRNDNGIYNSTGVSNPFAGIDVGTNSKPVFADIDGDGDLDLVVTDHAGMFSTFQNDNGVFTEITTPSPFEALDGLFSVGLAFADLDGDGDDDLLVAQAFGGFFSWRNDGTSFSQTGWADPFADLDFSLITGQTFVDFDGDGDLDLVVAASAGSVNSSTFWVENTQGAFPPTTSTHRKSTPLAT